MPAYRRLKSRKNEGRTIKPFHIAGTVSEMEVYLEAD